MEPSPQPIQAIQRDLRQVKTEIDQIKNDIRFIKIVLQSKAEVKKLHTAENREGYSASLKLADALPFVQAAIDEDPSHEWVAL